MALEEKTLNGVNNGYLYGNQHTHTHTIIFEGRQLIIHAHIFFAYPHI